MEHTIDKIIQDLDRCYIICENQNDEERCVQIQTFLDSKLKDFTKLLLQVRERKSAFPSDLIHGTQAAAGMSNSGTKFKLRADAPTFQPTSFAPVVEQVKSSPISNPPSAPTPSQSASYGARVSKHSPPGLSQGKSSTPKTALQMKESQAKMMNSLPDLPSENSTSIEKRVHNIPGTSLIAPYDIPKQVNHPPPADSPGKEEWEKIVHAEMVRATEQVWAAAEAWIEAEAEAEEEEWKILEMGINRYVGLTQSPRYNNKRIEEDHASDDDDFNEEVQTAFSSPFIPASNDSSLFNHDDSITLKLPSKILDKNKDVLLVPIRSITPNKPLSSSGSRSKLDPSITSSGGSNRFSTPPATSVGRSLHEKLSSPDRKRAISPTEALKRYEARLSAAELNRDKTVAEKVQKAMIASNRVKLKMLKEAERQAQASEALKQKLRHAADRHLEYLNEIRGKAGNENAKVIEVLSSNALNSEALADQLQSKLEEVEARILAANIRREQRLADISGSQRKKNVKKSSDQMSEYRLQLEKQKMERWEKLKRRLEAVQERRKARLVQIQQLEEDPDNTSTTSNHLISSSLLFNNSATIDDISISIIASSDTTPMKIEIHSPSKDDHVPPASSGTGTSGMVTSHSTNYLNTPESSSTKSQRDSRNGLDTSASQNSAKRHGTPHKSSSITNNDHFNSEKNKLASTAEESQIEDFVFSFPTYIIEKAFNKFSDLINKSKLHSYRNEAWNSALACLETSNSFYSLYYQGSTANVVSTSDQPCSPLQFIVRHLIVDNNKKARNPEERGASSYNLYASTAKEIDESGLNYSIDLVEKINILIQQTLDLANVEVNGVHVIMHSDQGWDKLQDFIQTGGVLLLAVLLSREYGMLARMETITSLFTSAASLTTDNSVDVAVPVINFRNVLKLIFAIIHYLSNGISAASRSQGERENNIASCIHILAGCNIHMLVSELCLFFLFLQQEFHQYASQNSVSVTELHQAMASLRIELAKMLFMWTQLVMKILAELDQYQQQEELQKVVEGSTESTSTYAINMKLLHNIVSFQQFSFLCNHLPLLFSTIQIDVVNLLGNVADEDRRNQSKHFHSAVPLYKNIASYAKMIAIYVSKHSRIEKTASSHHHAATSAKHWWSLMRRSNVIQVMVDSFDYAMKCLLTYFSSLTKNEKDNLLELMFECLDSIFIMITIDKEIFKHVASNRQHAFIDGMHFFLLAANTEYLAEFQKHQEDNIIERSLFRLFSIVTTLSHGDLTFRKVMGENLNSTTSTTSSNHVDAGYQALFMALVNSIRQQRHLSYDETNHYQSLLTNMKSFLQSICNLPIKWYKDKRMKHVIIPCLLMVSFEFETHTQLIRQFGKDKYIKKYLDHYYVREKELRDQSSTPGNSSTRMSSLVPAELCEIMAMIWNDNHGKI